MKGVKEGTQLYSKVCKARGTVQWANERGALLKFSDKPCDYFFCYWQELQLVKVKA